MKRAFKMFSTYLTFQTSMKIGTRFKKADSKIGRRSRSVSDVHLSPQPLRDHHEILSSTHSKPSQNNIAKARAFIESYTEAKVSWILHWLRQIDLYLFWTMLQITAKLAPQSVWKKIPWVTWFNEFLMFTARLDIRMRGTYSKLAFHGEIFYQQSRFGSAKKST